MSWISPPYASLLSSRDWWHALRCSIYQCEGLAVRKDQKTQSYVPICPLACPPISNRAVNSAMEALFLFAFTRIVLNARPYLPLG
jgi:hypothetical protein